MADRIKGIVVEIGGDTTGLSKALSGVNREIGSTQSQLRDVERLLKLDPTNTQLLEQKQRLLASAISQTKEKLDTLKTAEKQVQEQFKRGEISREQYEALQREIAATAQELERFEQKAKDGTSALEKMGSAAQTVSDKAGGVQKAFAPVTAAVGGLTAAAVATVPATEELRSDLSKLDQAARDNAVGAETARKAWEAFAVASDETDSAVEATANLLQAGFTESNLQKAVEGLTGAYLRFPDTLKIESLADSLQETLATGEATGQFAELLDRLGVNTERFADQMASARSESERQKVVLDLLAKEGLPDTYAEWKKNNEALIENKEANLELQQSMAKLAETALPLITQVTEAAAGLLEWFTNLDSGVQGFLVTIAGVLAMISPVAGAISGVSGLVAKLSTGILPGLIGTLTKLSATVIPAIGQAVTALLSIVAAHPFLAGFTVTALAVLAFSDEIKAAMDALAKFFTEKILPAWNSFFTKAGELVGKFAGKVSEIVGGVQDLFTGLINFIKTNFTDKWKAAWEAVADIFKKVMDLLGDIVKAPINAIITAINFVIKGINALVDALNLFSIDIPDWVPGIGGKTFGFDLDKIEEIPYLAKGGIVTRGSAIVGEAGPELLTVAGGRAIVQPLTGAAAGTTVYQTNNFNGTYKPRDGEAAVRDLNRRLGWVY